MIFPDPIQKARKPQRPWLDTGPVVADIECRQLKNDELKEAVKDLAKKVRTNMLAFEVYDAPDVDDDDVPDLFGGDDCSDDDDDDDDDDRDDDGCADGSCADGRSDGE